MKRVALAVTPFLVVALVAGSAFGWSCPRLVNEANQAIGQAEATAARTTDERQKARNTALIEEAKELAKAADESHKAGNHGRAEAKAHAAKALAALVK